MMSHGRRSCLRILRDVSRVTSRKASVCEGDRGRLIREKRWPGLEMSGMISVTVDVFCECVRKQVAG